jgi:transposase
MKIASRFAAFRSLSLTWYRISMLWRERVPPSPSASVSDICTQVSVTKASDPDAAEAAGMDRQTLRDWVIRYNAHGLDGLSDCWGDGRPPRLEAHEQAELMRIVLEGPDPESGLSAFTREDLVRICEARFGKTFHPASLGRILKRLGFSRQKARPSHPQKDPALAEAFKRGSGGSESHQPTS